MKICFASAAIAASAAFATPAFACASCGCNLSSDWLSQGLVSRPGTTISLRYDDVPQTDLRSEHRKLDRSAIALPADREIEQYTYNHYVTLTLDHQLDSRWGFDLQLPYIHRPHATIDEGETARSTSRTQGIGDIRAAVRRQFSDDKGITGFQFGVKLPTGHFHQGFRSGPTAGEEVDRGLQPGTGTTDVTLAAYRSGQIGEGIGYFLQAQGQIALNHRADYRPGNAATISAGLQYGGWKGITPQLQLNARVASRDSGADADRENSGGEQIYLAPGVSAGVSEHLSAFAHVQVPLYQRVDGYQLAPRYTLSFGLQYRL